MSREARGEQEIEMARRTSWRVPININVSLIGRNGQFRGRILNLSENGMFISFVDKISDPEEEMMVSLATEKETIEMPVRLVRLVRSNGSYGAAGVEVVNPPREYLDFLESLLSMI
jgi:hypothetical protein